MIKYICFLLIFFFLQSAWSASEDAMRFAEPPKRISYYMHYCHFRGSITSQLISSDKLNPQEACADVHMEVGKSYPMLHTCLDEDGNISRTVYSPLSSEEACGRINTVTLERFIEILCENDEDPENCKSERMEQVTSIRRENQLKQRELAELMERQYESRMYLEDQGRPGELVEPGQYLKNQGRPGELVDTRYRPPFFMEDGIARPTEYEDKISLLYNEILQLQHFNLPHQDMKLCNTRDELVDPNLCIGWIDPENRPRGR